MNLIGVPIADVPAVWPVLRPIIAKAMRRHGDGRWTVEHVYAWLQTGEMQLWTDSDYKGVCITQILVYPTGKKELLIWLAATRSGHLENEMELFDQIVKSAKEIGCAKVSAYCRKGFLKKLDDWKIRSVELVKEI